MLKKLLQENMEPWLVVLLLLPLIIFMIFIKYREKKMLVPGADKLTGLQKAWLFAGLLPPEASARLLLHFAAEEVHEMLRSAAAIPATSIGLLNGIMHEMSEFFPRLKNLDSKTLGTPGAVEEKDIALLASAMRSAWITGLPFRNEAHADLPVIQRLLVEFITERILSARSLKELSDKLAPLLEEPGFASTDLAGFLEKLVEEAGVQRKDPSQGTKGSEEVSDVL